MSNLTRRGFLRASSAASLLASARPIGLPSEALARASTVSAAETKVNGRALWEVPACAWNRPLGIVPKIAMRPERIEDSGELNGLNTPTRTRKGIPLGGIGAGNFMYNLCGSFGPWQMKPGRYEERFLPQAAFHLREQNGPGEVTSRTLATEDVLSAWPRLNAGEGRYYALFPKGWCTYDGFATNVSMQFFSPVIKDNYKETSYPVALFLFRLHNPRETPTKLSVMFTFPNAPYTGRQNTPLGQDQNMEASKSYRSRKGLTNKFIQNEKNGIVSILMSARDAGNSPETDGTEWCIATNQPATYVPAWDGNGDGGDIWRCFATDGALGNKDLTESSAMPAGALCAAVDLKPGSIITVPFALAWYFPQMEFNCGTRWWRRFSEWFPAGQGQAFSVCKEALFNHDKWLAAVDEWQRPILRSDAHPDWLKQSMLNELYYATFGGSFWENGCITKAKKFGNRPGQHISFVMECQEYANVESFDVRHHPARSNRDLWPEQERSTLLLFKDFIMDTPDGSCPHDAGDVNSGDPLFLYDAYGRYYNQGPLGIKGRITTPWSELSPKFIQQCYAYWHKTKDDKFLNEVWPAMVRSYHYQITTDLDGDGLSEMKSSEYIDNKLLNAVLWIGALEMLVEVARIRKDVSFADEVAAMLEKARASTEKQFWNAQYGYYQYNQHNQDVMGDAMIGQRYIDITGLRPVLNPERLTSHYRQLFRRGVMALKDTDGDGIGDMGVANAVHPDSLPGIGDSEYLHQFEIWTGVSYCAAANLYHWGKSIDDGALQANAMLAAWGVYRHTWMDESTGYWFSTPEAWRIIDQTVYRALMYQRARGIWEFAMEVGDPFST